MSKEEEISKELDTNPDNVTDPKSVPAAEQKGLNGHGEDSPASAAAPEASEAEDQSAPADADSTESSPEKDQPPKPELNDEVMEGQEEGQSQTSVQDTQASSTPNVEDKQAPEKPEEQDTQDTAETAVEEPSPESTPVDEVSETSKAETAPSEELEPDGETTQPTAESEPKTKTPSQDKSAYQVSVWESKDFSALDKSALVSLMEEMAKAEDPIAAERIAKKLRPFFIKIQKAQRQRALDQFVAEGNDADGFAYRFDELDNRFDAAYKLLRDKKFQRLKEQEQDKERNLQEKTQLLEELRALVEAEETNSSINALKKIQERWRSLGPVPGKHAKTMWANYHALLDLYYDHRSIYFELKELDRKKNLTAKLELCERAEKLDGQENLKAAISELNELHDEFKHIGPVPKSEQEALWQRFKAASDKIYARRKEFVKHLKEDLKKNLIKKSELAEEVQQYVGFSSDRITEWNKKTQALLELQKRWDAIGGLPRDKAKAVNRKFWGAFKGFFQNKGQFFKKLEGERGSNLEKKQALVAEAQAHKDSTDWDQTANKLKNLQRQWREIGPVPEKNRNEVYAQFKEACDHFFNNRRAQSKEVEKEYVQNLQKKQEICIKIEAMTTSKEYDLEKFRALKDQFNEIGYVPSSEVRNIREQFKTTVAAYLDGAPEEMEAEARRLKYDIEFEKLKSGPQAGRKKGQKEQALRREISALENDISTWKNNLEFFAASKTADKLREEFTGKIEAASEQLRELKRQLRALRQL